MLESGVQCGMYEQYSTIKSSEQALSSMRLFLPVLRWSWNSWNISALRTVRVKMMSPLQLEHSDTTSHGSAGNNFRLQHQSQYPRPEACPVSRRHGTASSLQGVSAKSLWHDLYHLRRRSQGIRNTSKIVAEQQSTLENRPVHWS